MSLWSSCSLVRLQLKAVASLQSLGLEPSGTCSVLGDGLMGMEESVSICRDVSSADAESV